MPTSVEPRIRTIAGVTAAGDTKFVTNGNATDYLNVRLTDGTAFYTASSSGGGGATTTVDVGSYGGTATTLGQKAMAASMPVVLPNNQTVAVNVANFSDNAFSNTSNIGSYGGVSTTLGQKSMAASIPTVIASDQTAIPVNSSQNGAWFVTANVSNSVTVVQPTPTNFQATINNASWGGVVTTLGNKSMAASVPVTMASDQTPFQVNASQLGSWFTTSNVSNTVTVTGSLITIAQAPTTTVTQSVATNFKAQIDNSSWGGVATSLGNKAMATSVPVTMASDQTAFTVNASQNGAWFVTANVSNTIAANVNATQSVASNFKAQIDNSSWGGTATTLGNKSMAASVPVTMASDQTAFGVNASQSGTWSVTAAQTIPSNFQNTTNVNSYGGAATSLGRKAMAASEPVTIASDQGSFAVTATVTNVVTTAQPIASNFLAQVNVGSYGGTATTLGQKAMSASMPVVIASDQSSIGVAQATYSNLNASVWRRESSATVLTAINTTYDNAVTTGSSADVTITGYKTGTFACNLSAINTPTDITFNLYYKGSTGIYFPCINGFWGRFIFDDTAVATLRPIYVHFPLPNSDAIKITTTATGTTSVNKFVVSDAEIRLGTL